MENAGFSSLQKFFDSAMAGLPNLLAALGIFIFGYILAKVLKKLSGIIFERFRIDRLSDKLNEIEIVAKTNIKILPSKILSSIIYYAILLLSLIAATDLLKMPTISVFLQDTINYLPKAMTAILILIIGVLFCDFIRKIIYTAGKSVGMPAARIVSTIIFYFLFINVFISSLAQAGIETEFIQSNLTMIIGGIAVAFGISYGLASKDILSNMLSAYYNKKIKEGDYITIGSYTGYVKEVNKTDVILKVKDDLVYIPLSKTINENVIVHSERNEI